MLRSRTLEARGEHRQQCPSPTAIAPGKSYDWVLRDVLLASTQRLDGVLLFPLLASMCSANWQESAWPSHAPSGLNE